MRNLSKTPIAFILMIVIPILGFAAWAFSTASSGQVSEYPDTSGEAPVEKPTFEEEAVPAPTDKVPTNVEGEQQESEWEPVVELASIVGDWTESSGKTSPTFSIEVGRPGSKTPANFRFRTRTMEGGCGLYEGTGTSYCKVHDEDNRKVPRAVQGKAFFHRRGAELRVAIEGLTPEHLEFILVRDQRREVWP